MEPNLFLDLNLPLLFAAEPWYNANLYGWLPGALYGSIGGGIGGTVMGTLAPKGKAKSFVLGWCYGCIALAVAFLAIGITAFISGQPYGIWFGLLWPGFLGLLLFPPLTWLVHKRYREAEARLLQAQNL
jgi:hypothetical protein